MATENTLLTMTDDSTLDGGEEPFGVINSRGRGRFGLIRGGEGNGGLLWLLEEADRERGFLSRSDRQTVLEMQTIDLDSTTQRNSRTRIRNRVLAAFFDARFLRYIHDRDRGLIFRNARQAGYDLQFKEGFKEFVRFTYRGLLEDEVDVDTAKILETAIREAEQEVASAAGEDATFRVNIDVTRVPGDGVAELERRYTNREYLNRRELEVLVNSRHETPNVDVVDAADIDLVDALYYDARQPQTDPYGYSWEDPDREEAEEIVGRLRSVLGEHGVETYDQLENAVERLTAFDEEVGETLRADLSRLSRAAANFPTQMAASADLPEQDMELLNSILWNPDNIDVGEALERYTRPPTAGDEWSPDEDESLQRFIARVEVAREMNAGFASGGEEGRERWREVLYLADFDPDEWKEYMDEQRVKRLITMLQEEFEAGDLPPDAVESAESYDELLANLEEEGIATDFDVVAGMSDEEIALEAARRVAYTEEKDE
jgi:hypothetical protein